MTKRSTTRWMFRVNYRLGGHIRVGRVYHDDKADMIRYDIKSTVPNGSVDYACTFDEAMNLAAGLNYVLASVVSAQGKKVRKLFR